MAKTAIQKVKLPKLEEIIRDKDMSIPQKEYFLQAYLNFEPPAAWIKKHPFAKIDYIPIERQEWLMTMVFHNWYVEVLRSELILNSICVTVRVHYWNPVAEKWQWTDGVGANPLQMDKDATITDFTHLKPNAVQIGFPAAKSYAFKDAVESLGRFFGRDLNRKNNADYSFLMERATAPIFEEEKEHNIEEGIDG